ncbi:MAG TPA: hypothetical protein VNJ08_01530 [Bacteriovoracaceae bacterium]|nr:hypothetical protein [Bacteriovoracaceae bacterium]
MKLIKIILIIFCIYFIRRFIQLYRVMKKVQQEQQLNAQAERGTGGPRTERKAPETARHVVDAEYKVMDN